MIRKVFKIGQSSAIVIPMSIMLQKKIKVGDYVEIKDDYIKCLKQTKR